METGANLLVDQPPMSDVRQFGPPTHAQQEGTSVQTRVPFYRPDIGNPEIEEVVAALRSGWLTTGPRVKQFETCSPARFGAPHAVALNSCTAALHLAVHALGLGPGDGVLVPSMTFAATAEVIRYEGAVPILVDCDPATLNMDLRGRRAQAGTASKSGGALAGLPARRAGRRHHSRPRRRPDAGRRRGPRVRARGTTCGWSRTRLTRFPAAWRKSAG